MGTAGKTWTRATAACPWAEHAGSHVRFDGQYGKPDHRRQRYRSIPSNGDPPHRFAEELPREEAWHGSCEYCERPVHLHEGPHAARQYQFVARGIAGALSAVGAGLPYRQAALVARERARRLRTDPDTGELRFTRHGQLVMDWVEVFAPVVFEPHRPTAWPATGTLLLDDLPFSVRDPATGRARIAFRVFCAAGYERGRLRLWRLEAFTDKSQASWMAFLGALEGAPERVVCDNDGGLTGAVSAAFPEADLYLCEWHLRHALERLMTKIHRQDPQHQPAIDALRPRVEAAFVGASFWRPFVRDALAANIPSLTAWLTTTGAILEAQFRRRGLSTRPRSMPLTTSPMDGLIQAIRDAITPRRYGFKNRERLNRLLMLMQLHANRQDNERAYTKTIRAWLEANHGRPQVDRRAIADLNRIASLR